MTVFLGHALAALAARAMAAHDKPYVDLVAGQRAAAMALRPSRGPAPRQAAHKDRSRYTGEMLRAIRAERGCGRPPKVLAARRAKATGVAP